MAKLSPIFNGQTEDGNGAPAVGWKIYTYAAGSSTDQATYTAEAGDVPQANPIVLNAAGQPDNAIWLAEGLSYKFILKDASDVVKQTIDNVAGVNDTATTADEWQDSGLSTTYVSATSYTVPGDQTSALRIGRRQKFTVTAGTAYGRITGSSYNGSTLTTVTMQMDGSQVLDSGLTSLQNSILRSGVSSMPVRAAATSGTDTYTASVGVLQYVKDDEYQIKIATANTSTTPTLNLDSLGAKTIVNIDGSALYAGALNGEHTLRFDGTNMVVLNPTGGANAPMFGQCVLTKSGANLVLSRKNGKYLTINGKAEVIPAAGVSLAPTSLSVTTLYFIYAYMNSGTMTLEASTTAHATDSNTGMEIKSGDATRTLVGMARTITGPAWVDTEAQRFVLSYFNRKDLNARRWFTAARTTASATYVELNTEIRCEFLTWGDEVSAAYADGRVSNATASGFMASSIGIDGTTAEEAYSVFQAYTNGATGGFGIAVPKSGLSEGYHYATLLGWSSGGTGTWFGGANPGDRSSLKVIVKG